MDFINISLFSLVAAPLAFLAYWHSDEYGKYGLWIYVVLALSALSVLLCEGFYSSGACDVLNLSSSKCDDDPRIIHILDGWKKINQVARTVGALAIFAFALIFLKSMGFYRKVAQE